MAKNNKNNHTGLKILLGLFALLIIFLCGMYAGINMAGNVNFFNYTVQRQTLNVMFWTIVILIVLFIILLFYLRYRWKRFRNRKKMEDEAEAEEKAREKERRNQ